MFRSEMRIQTIVLQPTPFCNIRCKYCYLPTRDDKSVMSLDTIRATFEKVFASPYASTHITVIWHAGEPLVLPVSYYESAFQAIEQLRPSAVEIRHSFQTNGTLVSKEWADLFRRWDVRVGVSIDGPRHMHDSNRVTRGGKGTFDLAIRGARLLKEEGIPFHVISVLSKEGLERPEELHAFYLDQGIEDVCFNVEESEGSHVSELMTLSRDSMRAKFLNFLHRFWTLSRQRPGINFIREIDGLIPRIFRPEEAQIGNDQVEPFAMLNVDCHGNVSSFSPELLGYKNDRYNDFIVGNVHQHTLEQMRESPAMLAMLSDIDAGVEACRKECNYFSICGGGAPVNKLSENGTFASTQTSFCNLIQITPANLILGAFDQMELSLAKPVHAFADETTIFAARTAESAHANALSVCA
ncbi:MAG TPA: cyclophane-forming radical SAM/SPASM peptide maturase GrrM/OscB [Terracidiphilus sp.]